MKLRNKKQFKYFLIIVYILISLNIKRKIKKVGIVGLQHSRNIGNNLLKYAIYIKLIEFGLDPYIIGVRYGNSNISFLLNTVKVRLINKTFNEIKLNDYDILMVNSDQTWRRQKSKYFYDIAFLNFSKNWNITKFVYGASLGLDFWHYTKEEEEIAKSLLKNFKGISVREKGSIKLIQNHLGIKPTFVLDPTLLIDKKYYLKLIKNFKIQEDIGDNFIFIYKLINSRQLKVLIKNITEKYNYKIYLIDYNVVNHIQKFIYGVYNCKAVITDSFHGTIFSIIFNKPFISLVYKSKGKERFNTLKEIFNLHNRIINYDSYPDIKLLKRPLLINKNILNSLRKEAFVF